MRHHRQEHEISLRQSVSGQPIRSRRMGFFCAFSAGADGKKDIEKTLDAAYHTLRKLYSKRSDDEITAIFSKSRMLAVRNERNFTCLERESKI